MPNKPMILTTVKNELIERWTATDDLDEIKESVRAFMLARYPDLEEETFALKTPAEMKKTWSTLNSCCQTFKDSPAGKRLKDVQHAKFACFNATALFRAQYDMQVGGPREFVELEVDAAIHDHMHAAMLHAVNTGNRLLAYSTLSYGSCSRGKLLRPGEERKVNTRFCGNEVAIDHVNNVDDLSFVGERIAVRHPEKDADHGSYYKIALLDNELMEKAWRLIYSQPCKLENELALAELKSFEFDGKRFDDLVKIRDRAFTFRYLRNLGLTMLTRVWAYESGGDYEGDLEFVQAQAHHKCEDTSKGYRASTVSGEIAVRGKVFSHIKSYKLYDDVLEPTITADDLFDAGWPVYE